MRRFNPFCPLRQNHINKVDLFDPKKWDEILEKMEILIDSNDSTVYTQPPDWVPDFPRKSVPFLDKVCDSFFYCIFYIISIVSIIQLIYLCYDYLQAEKPFL